MEKVTDRKPAQLNGQNGASKVKTEAKAEKETPKKETPVIPIATPQDRFNKMEQFSNLRGKFERLRKLDHDLKNFKIGNDGLNSKIELVNGEGARVTIAKPEVMERVLELCQQELNSSLQKAQEEVMNFEI